MATVIGVVLLFTASFIGVSHSLKTNQSPQQLPDVSPRHENPLKEKPCSERFGKPVQRNLLFSEGRLNASLSLTEDAAS